MELTIGTLLLGIGIIVLTYWFGFRTNGICDAPRKFWLLMAFGIAFVVGSLLHYAKMAPALNILVIFALIAIAAIAAMLVILKIFDKEEGSLE